MDIDGDLLQLFIIFWIKSLLVLIPRMVTLDAQINLLLTVKLCQTSKN